MFNIYSFGYTNDSDLYSFVPDDALYVIDSDNITYYYDEVQHFNNDHNVDVLSSASVANVVLKKLIDFASNITGHTLGGSLNHVLISAHDSVSPETQVMYFSINFNSSVIVDKIIKEILSANGRLITEHYNNEKYYVCPANNELFLNIYNKSGVVAISSQKRLIERVIDSYKDGRVLSEDRTFRNVKVERKIRNYLTIYTNSMFDANILSGKKKWNKLDVAIYNNSISFMGEIVYDKDDTICESIKSKISHIPYVFNDSVLISDNRDSTKKYIEAYRYKKMKGTCPAFNESVFNLSRNYQFSFVADLCNIYKDSLLYKKYVIPYVLSKSSNFKDFIYSTQLSFTDSKLYYVIMITSKN